MSGLERMSVGENEVLILATGGIGFLALRWIANQNEGVELEPQFKDNARNIRRFSWIVLMFCIGYAVYLGWSA